MSVGDEQTECPLCMEPLELDDINFFPCTCGYQICRFCWHRIRTDENGLCPACRKQYPEDPAEFRPLTEDELQRIKKERRQKEAQRKQKAAENRKHLANVRVVQKNLVFVVGLSQRLADVETLKKHEYFGKFGKIHKVVINQSTSYAGAQVGDKKGPSASAYVTYHRPEDALKAIQAVNNIHVEGRTLKASLGTTKYCSHFLRGAQCPKPDCMYLHELGEEAASFTKEEMQQGKHQEYEQKLYEFYMNSQNLANSHGSGSGSPGPGQSSSPNGCLVEGGAETPPEQGATPPPPSAQQTLHNRKKTESPIEQNHGHSPPEHSDAWPTLSNKAERLTNGNSRKSDTQVQQQPQPQHSRAPGHHRPLHTDINNSQSKEGLSSSTNGQSGHSHSPPVNPPAHSFSSTQQLQTSQLQTQLPTQLHSGHHQGAAQTHSPLAGATKRSPFENPVDSMSLFSSTNGFPSSRNPKPAQPSQPTVDSLPTSTEIPETIPVSSSTDWQAAFGFTSAPHQQPHNNTATTTTDNSSINSHDDDLGFDPWDESAKALADLIEKESVSGPAYSHPGHPLQSSNHRTRFPDNRPKNLPPGFAANHLGAFPSNPMGPASGSKILNLMKIPPSGNSNSYNNMDPNNTYHDVLSDISLNKDQPQNHDMFNTKDWQDGLRALLPNINISFGHGQNNQNNQSLPLVHQRPPPQNHPHSNALPHKSNTVTEEPPHWMASLHHLTEETNSHRMPFVHQFHLRGGNGVNAGWSQQSPNTSHPPPGFHQSQIRQPITPEGQKVEPLQ